MAEKSCQIFEILLLKFANKFRRKYFYFLLFSGSWDLLSLNDWVAAELHTYRGRSFIFLFTLYFSLIIDVLRCLTVKRYSIYICLLADAFLNFLFFSLFFQSPAEFVVQKYILSGLMSMTSKYFLIDLFLLYQYVFLCIVFSNSFLHSRSVLSHIRLEIFSMPQWFSHPVQCSQLCFLSQGPLLHGIKFWFTPFAVVILPQICLAISFTYPLCLTSNTLH